MISVCIASRGRPELLGQTVASLKAGMMLPETRIAIALDDDDDTRWNIPRDESGRSLVSTAPREDALGAKFNRAYQIFNPPAGFDDAWGVQMPRPDPPPGNLSVLWADDMVMPEHGWDKKLQQAAERLQDNCGAVLFGDIPGILQPGIAVTHKFVEAMGFFCPPYFPTWYSDTWVLEIAHMADRIVRTNVKVELLNPVKGTSRGVREISFWATLFDELRPARRAVAEKIIDEGSDMPTRKEHLKARLPQLEAAFLQSNSVCRDPVSATKLEQHYAFDAPADERYLRLKAQAEAMLKEFS